MHDSISDEEYTPIVCGACGGNFLTDRSGTDGYALFACRWCTRGAQTLQEREVWEQHRKTQRESGVRPRAVAEEQAAKPLKRTAT